MSLNVRWFWRRLGFSQKGTMEFLSAARSGLHVLILLLAFLLLVRNLRSINEFVNRLSYSPAQVAIPGVVTVSVSSEGGAKHEERWAAYYRVSGALAIDLASFDEERTGEEYVELSAHRPVNLGGGFIGDADELLYLGDKGIPLAPGERLRVYTFLARVERSQQAYLDSVRTHLGLGAVLALRISGNDAGGIFKYEAGEGDRIVLIGRDKEILLDVEYWWAAPR